MHECVRSGVTSRSPTPMRYELQFGDGLEVPKVLLSVAEVEHVLNQPDVSTPMGLRNRAMLETLFSTGVRRSEVAHLNLFVVATTRSAIAVGSHPRALKLSSDGQRRRIRGSHLARRPRLAALPKHR